MSEAGASAGDGLRKIEAGSERAQASPPSRHMVCAVLGMLHAAMWEFHCKHKASAPLPLHLCAPASLLMFFICLPCLPACFSASQIDGADAGIAHNAMPVCLFVFVFLFLFIFLFRFHREAEAAMP